MPSMSPGQVKKACERPPHAQWARPAGQVFKTNSYVSVWYVSIFTDDRDDIRGISKSLFIPVGPDTPGIGDRPLHSAAARHLLDLRHPVSRPDRRSRLSVLRVASRHRTLTPAA